MTQHLFNLAIHSNSHSLVKDFACQSLIMIQKDKDQKKKKLNHRNSLSQLLGKEEEALLRHMVRNLFWKTAN